MFGRTKVRRLFAGNTPAHSFNQRIERGGFLGSELMDVSVKGEHLSGAIFTDTQARP